MILKERKGSLLTAANNSGTVFPVFIIYNFLCYEFLLKVLQCLLIIQVVCFVKDYCVCFVR